MFSNRFTHIFAPRVLVIGLMAFAFCLGIPAMAQTPISSMSEEELWSFAKEKNTEDAYRIYLLKFEENGKWLEEARNRIASLRDEAEWNRAKAEDSPAAYRRYLDIEPYGKYAKEAKRKLGIQGGSPTRDNPRPSSPNNSNPKPPANTTPTSTTPTQPSTPTVVIPDRVVPSGNPSSEEEADWKELNKLGDIGGYQYFLNKYPQGKYAVEAVKKVPIEVIDNSVPGLDKEKNLTVKYAVPVLAITQIETLNSGLKSETLQPVSAEDGTTTYDWTEGQVKIVITPLNLTSHLISVQTQTAEALVLHFKDGVDSTAQYGVKPGEAGPDVSTRSVGSGGAFELLGMSGTSQSQDTLWFRLKGGEPPYFVRFSRKDQDIEGYKHEEELNRGSDGERWYVEKQFLSDRRKLGGTYYCYLTDKNRSEYQWAPEEVKLKGGLLGSIPVWAIALPVFLILAVGGVLWFLKRRNQQNEEEYF